jgi:hypothetical protein
MITTEPRTKDKDGYLILPKEFTAKSFKYTQLIREGDLAIYKQEKPGEKVITFEVVKISRHSLYKLGGVDIPAAETYPSTSTWGQNAWTLTTYEDALKKYNQLKK